MIPVFLKHRLAAPIAAGVFLLLSLGLLVYSIQATAQRDQARGFLITEQKAHRVTQASLATCQANTAQLKFTIGQQNAQIGAWRAERDRALSDSRKALKAAQDARRATDGAIVSALNRKPQSADYCEQARELEIELRRLAP